VSEITLQLNGSVYGGWVDASVQRSIEQVSGTFELGVTERWPDQPTARQIRPGDACTVQVDGETVITGYVDDVDLGYDKETHAVQIRGRDATGDLVDSSAMSGKWKGQTLAKLATTVCEPFGISVTDLAQDDYTFTALETDSGETVFELLERASRHVGVLLVSDGVGGLVLTRAGTERIGTRLELGKNILAGRANFSHRDRFSEYRVIGQSAGTDNWNGTQASGPVAKVKDTRIKRHRPTTIDAEETITPALAKQRAIWQRNASFGRSQAVTYTVQGWRHADGLWTPNRMVSVFDSFIGLEVEWLLVSTAFSLGNDGGQLTDLTLMPREAFELIPLPESTDGSWVS